MGKLKLGSLFDGSGGFPLGGLLAGITPVWASEIEPFPIRVTTKRLPQVKHYGDVSVLDGADLPPVDIITFGSPCQNMSIAGKREGLEGKQSSLFYEAIRIVKEMRCATDGKYPRFIVWENVTGAFSSKKGEDFRTVLKAVCSVKGGETDIPRPAKWPGAGEIMADGFSVAWRVFDAQHWGVPQRRKRIYLVADFAGGSAGNILFESEGLSGYSAAGFRTWQRATRNPAAGSGTAGGSICLNDQGGQRMEITKNRTNTLRAWGHHPPLVADLRTYDVRFTSEGTRNARQNVYETDTARSIDTSGNPPDSNQGGVAVVADIAAYALTMCSSPQVSREQAPALLARDFKDPAAVNRGYTVRRLTPTECARLQGFPDWWCAGLETPEPTEADIAFWTEVWETHRRIIGTTSRPKTEKQIIKWLKHPHLDSAEYKMWGNGVALPCVFFVLAGIVWSTQVWPA